jgi:DNA-directed RNA polymerase subunit F
MSNAKLISERPITMAELKLELEKVKKRDEELNFRANKTEEYINQVISIDPKKAGELRGKLEKLNVPRLREEHIAKVIDVAPTTVEEVSAIAQAFTISITKDNMKKIADILKEYVKEE